MNSRDLIAKTFDVVFSNHQRFVEALALPFALMVGLDLLALIEIPFPLGLVYGVFSMLLYAIFAIITHRLVILGDDSVPRYGMSSLSKREMLFLGYSIVIPLILALPIVLLLQFDEGGLKTLLLIAGASLYAYIITRVSLVFPAVAIDKWVTPLTSWQMTRSHQSTMLLGLLFFPLMLGGIVSLISFLLAQVFPYIVISIFESLAGSLLLVFTITILSLIYAEITYTPED